MVWVVYYSRVCRTLMLASLAVCTTTQILDRSVDVCRYKKNIFRRVLTSYEVHGCLFSSNYEVVLKNSEKFN